METRDLVMEYNRAFGEGNLDRVADLLHPGLVFGGATAQQVVGSHKYVAALRRLAPVVVRNEVKDIVVEGERAAILYDFVTDSGAGAVLSAEFLTVEAGLIRTITLLFDWRRWPEVLAEVASRAGESPSGGHS